MIVNCWEEAGEYPNTSTCMLLDGHDGPHDFTPDDEISIGFLPPDPLTAQKEQP